MRPERPRQRKSPPPASASIQKTDADDSSDRTIRLAKLKHAIDSGTYRISSTGIADKLIERLRDAPPKT